MMDAQQQTVAQLIRHLESRRFEAVVARDFEVFIELSHPDLVYVHSSGVVDTLESYVAKCQEGYYVYHHIEHPIDDIRVLGATALVFGGMDARLMVDGQPRSLHNRSIAVWMKLEGHSEKIYSTALRCWQQPRLILDSVEPSYVAYSRY